ncbi:MAG: hypothetical protein IJ617_02885 [Oscillospiraceae bacterium]|nr:hypothetical protein [Oscillospiraceae bacterium]
MSRILMILEVSRKQDYIFSSRRLRDNVARSAEIRAATQSAFFQENAGEHYDKREHLVYSGGGHTVLQFPDAAAAMAFARAVSAAALRRYPEMELYIKQRPYDGEKSPDENLKELTAALERKKSMRRPSFRWLDFGIETLDRESCLPARPETERTAAPEPVKPPEGWKFPSQFKELAGKDNFISVVHIDGNAMGKRVEGLLEGEADWDNACARLRNFSDGVDADFRGAFSETVEQLLRDLPELAMENSLPIRPVILAGDDVCFVTAGSLGLECARIFLEKLTVKVNVEDKKPYSACAGVALVHQKYPFHMAYALSEELCSSAKRFGVENDESGAVSAMDWHIEFGQLKDGLSEIREDYRTGDGSLLTLRPVTVVVPEGISGEKTGGLRTYAFFRAMCSALRGEYGKVARGKIKELRTALKQGKIETDFFLADKEITNLLDHVFRALYRSEDARWERFGEMLNAGSSLRHAAFEHIKGEETARSLLFDAIEMIDHFTPLGEVTEK